LPECGDEADDEGCPEHEAAASKHYRLKIGETNLITIRVPHRFCQVFGLSTACKESVDSM
jgi:hypothetical protein